MKISLRAELLLTNIVPTFLARTNGAALVLYSCLRPSKPDMNAACSRSAAFSYFESDKWLKKYC
jgi:hypothetical protein